MQYLGKKKKIRSIWGHGAYFFSKTPEIWRSRSCAVLACREPAHTSTDPEVAWVGVTETEAKQQKLKYGKGLFPWAASGRSLSLGREEGLTKLIFDEATERIIGAGLVGPNAGDLIAEVTLAIETGCDARDIGLTLAIQLELGRARIAPSGPSEAQTCPTNRRRLDN